MITRTVLMKLNDTADAAALAEMQHRVGRIRAEVPEVLAYDFVPNEAAGPGDFNWVILARFADEAAMNAYRVAPLHTAFIAYTEPYTDDYIITWFHAGDAAAAEAA